MAISPKPISKRLLIAYTTINFDDVSDGSAIDTRYAAQGVTFASITTNPVNTWSAYARKASNAETQPNVISVNQTGEAAFDANTGGLKRRSARRSSTCVSMHVL